MSGTPCSASVHSGISATCQPCLVRGAVRYMPMQNLRSGIMPRAVPPVSAAKHSEPSSAHGMWSATPPLQRQTWQTPRDSSSSGWLCRGDVRRAVNTSAPATQRGSEPDIELKQRPEPTGAAQHRIFNAAAEDFDWSAEWYPVAFSPDVPLGEFACPLVRVSNSLPKHECTLPRGRSCAPYGCCTPHACSLRGSCRCVHARIASMANAERNYDLHDMFEAHLQTARGYGCIQDL